MLKSVAVMSSIDKHETDEHRVTIGSAAGPLDPSQILSSPCPLFACSFVDNSLTAAWLLAGVGYCPLCGGDAPYRTLKRRRWRIVLEDRPNHTEAASRHNPLSLRIGRFRMFLAPLLDCD